MFSLLKAADLNKLEPGGRLYRDLPIKLGFLVCSTLIFVVWAQRQCAVLP